MANKKNLPPAVYEFFRNIGHQSGTKIYKERGSEYFSKISKMRKTFGKQKVVEQVDN